MFCDTESANGASTPNPYPGRGPKTEQGRANQIAGASASAIAQWEAVRTRGGNRLGELTPKGRAAISAANIGRPKSPEQRAKMGAAQRKRQVSASIARQLPRIDRVISIYAPVSEIERVST
jgi:hypothetical protein